ncbi:hypothetical protein MAGR_46740 [Mycolicibacterium agri]|nr:hypothetical protein MAGR_46740 [Mycolicibacterium agri]
MTWRDILLTAGPNYTQLITDWSNSLDNILIAQGNIQGGAASFWNPIASASGGLLPTFTAGTTQTDLATISGIITALTDALNNASDLGVVPGLSADAAAIVLGGVLQGLIPIEGVDDVLTGAAGPLLETLAVLQVVGGVLGQLQAINDLLEPLGVEIDNLPSLTDLLGLTATQTEYNSSYAWPILGMDGQTSVGNTFVNLPELTLSDVLANVANIDLDIPNVDLGELTGLDAIPGLSQVLDLLGLGDSSPLDLLIDPLLAGLGTQLELLDDLVATPSVTAWVPVGSGAYNFPFDASIGWLAAMPTLALGPIPALSEIDLPIDLGIDPSAETVLMIPIAATGGQLPFGLASFGSVNAGLVFPTATGVTTLGGTTLNTFGLPLLGVSYSSLNVGQANYVGTNGFNINTGTTVGALVTPLGPVPLVYSLGAVNAGNSGIGVTLPSLFGVGLLPPIQIGEPVGQESSDGLIGKDILNLGLAVPTQVTRVADLVGMGAVFTPAEEVGTAVWNATVRPVGEQVTAALNDVNGPITNGLASGFEQFTGAIADATGGAPATTSTLAASAQPTAAPVAKSTTEPKAALSAKDITNVSARLDERLQLANQRIATATLNARNRTQAAVERTQAQLNNIAAEGQKAINNTVNGLKKTVNDTVNTVKGATDNLTKKKDADSKKGADSKKDNDAK